MTFLNTLFQQLGIRVHYDGVLHGYFKDPVEGDITVRITETDESIEERVRALNARTVETYRHIDEQYSVVVRKVL